MNPSGKASNAGFFLGDSPTNVFSLASLKGLRWKKFTTLCNSSPQSVSADSILSSYANLLACDILCAWQCVPRDVVPLLPDENSNLTSSSKTLIAFWYGSKPHWISLLSSQLKDIDSGSTENGWSLEYQGLLFQAIRNLLDRNLAKSGTRKLGEWYFDLCHEKSEERQIPAFNFKFFVYGESTIAVSVSVNPHFPLRKISADDIASAGSNAVPDSVYLSPFGFHGKLTGKKISQKDSNCLEVMALWDKYFPGDSPTDADVPGTEEPCLVEVAIGDRRLMYPSHLVLVRTNNNNCDSYMLHQTKLSPGCANEKLLTKIKSVRNDKTSRSMLRHIVKQLESRPHTPRMPITGARTEGANSNDTSLKPLWEFKEGNRHPACECLSTTSSTLRTKSSNRLFNPIHRHTASSTGSSSNTSSKRDQRRPTFPFHQRSLKKANQLIPLSTMHKVRQPSNSSTSTVSQLPRTMTPPVTAAVSASSSTNETSKPSECTLNEVISLQKVDDSQQGWSHLTNNNSASDPNGKDYDFTKYTATPESLASPSYLLPSSLKPNRPRLLLDDVDNEPIIDHLYQLYTMNTNNNSLSSADSTLPPDGRNNSGSTTSAVKVNKVEEKGNVKATAGSKRRHTQRPRGRPSTNNSTVQQQALLSPTSDPFAPVFDDPNNEGSSNYPSSAKRHRNDNILSPGNNTNKSSHKSKKHLKRETEAAISRHLPQTLSESTVAFNSFPSPPTPSFTSPTPRHSSLSLMSTKDLMVREDDLDRLFDNSDEEGFPNTGGLGLDDDVHHDMIKDKKDIGSSLHSNQIDFSPGAMQSDDAGGNSAYSRGGYNQTNFSQHDLAQMFPTPPSMEASSFATSPAMVTCNDHFSQLSSTMTHTTMLLSPDKAMLHQYGTATKGSDDMDVLHSTDYHSTRNSFGCDMFAPLKDLRSVKLRQTLAFKQLPRYQPSAKSSKGMLQIKEQTTIDCKTEGVSMNSTLSLDALTNTLEDVTRPIPQVELAMSLDNDPFLNMKSVERAPSNQLAICGESLELVLSLSTVLHSMKGIRYKMSSGIPSHLSSFVSSLCECNSMFLQDQKSPKTLPILSTDNIMAGDQVCEELISGSIDRVTIKPLANKLSLSLPLSESKLSPSKTFQLSNGFEHYLDQFSTPLASLFTSGLLDHHYNKSKEEEPLSRTQGLYEHTGHQLKQFYPKLKSALIQTMQHGFNNHTRLEGPLSFQSLHKQAGKSGLLSKINMHSLVLGHDNDWMSVSPMALRYWDKLMFEPYGGSRDVAYVVVAPENDTALDSTKLFFREHSSAYESLNLGRHVPVNLSLRDGILRVSSKAVLKLADENVDEWFASDDSTEGKRMKAIAQVCKYHLGPYLKTLSLDETILKGPEDKATEMRVKRHPPDIGVPSMSATSVPDDGSLDDNKQAIPAIVIYMIDPFTLDEKLNKPRLWSFIGLLKCYADMVATLPDELRNNVFVQILPIDYVMKAANQRSSELNPTKHTRCHYRQLSLSLYSRCRINTNLKSNAKALTGFCVNAAYDRLIQRKKADGQLPIRLYLAPCILSSTPQLVKEDVPSLNCLSASNINDNILMCAYAISADQQWMIVALTDRCGELSDTCVICLDPLKRSRGRSNVARQQALRKLWDYCHGFMSFSLLPWRLVMTRVGHPGVGEWQDFQSIVSERMVEGSATFNSPRNTPSPSCEACASNIRTSRYQQRSANRSSLTLIQSVSYVSIESENHISVLPNSNDDTVLWPCAGVFVTPPPIRMTNTDQISSDRRRSPMIATPRPLHPSASSMTLDGDSTSELMPLLSSLDGSMMHQRITSKQQKRQHPKPVNDLPYANAFQPVQPPSQAANMQYSNQTSPAGSSRKGGRASPTISRSVLAIGHLVSQQTIFDALPGHGLRNRAEPSVLKFHLLFHQSIPGASVNGSLMESNSNLEILRSVIELHDALSWLTVAPETGERQSCLASHVFALTRIQQSVRQLNEDQTKEPHDFSR